MSGDLKNPARALPWGTIAAVVVGYIVYMAIAVYLGNLVPAEVLNSNSMIMTEIAKFSAFVFVGIWGASLSSALGAMMGAPRTLEALSKDHVLPRLDLKICAIITYFVALVGIWLGDLNVIAPVLSMFFLTSYGFLNLAAGLEEFIGNPSWRPSFRTPWVFSFLGAFGCLSAMLMIDPGSTFIAIFLTFLIYYGMSRRELKSRWSDIRYSILLSLARLSIYGLSRLKVDARSWRPNFLVLTGSPQKRWYLIALADAITHGKGFLTVVSLFVSKERLEETRISSMERSVRDFLKKKGVPAFIEISSAEDILTGAENIIRNYGLGPIAPNTIVLGETEKEDQFESFVKLLHEITRLRRNILVVREGKEVPVPKRFFKKASRKIDVWWSRDFNNDNLMLALGHLIQTSPEWSGATLTLKSVVGREEEKEGALRHLQEFTSKSRIHANVEVYVGSGDPLDTIWLQSQETNLIFVGLEAFPKDFNVAAYTAYYKNILEKTNGLPPVVLTLASEDVQFKEIFN